MKRVILAVAVVGMSLGVMGSGAQAAGKHWDPPCVVNPNPAALDQAYSISASGLPTTTPVYLIVQPPTGNSSTSQVLVNADGTWSGAGVGTQTGTWTYTFSGVLQNNKYGTVASCSVAVN